MKSKKNIKSIVILAAVSIISLLFINMSLAASTGKVNVETANLRETADENSKILEQYSIGKEVEIIEKIGNWYKVKADGITGFLREDLLTVSGDVAQSTNQEANTTNVETTEPEEEQEINQEQNDTNVTNQESEETSQNELGKHIVKENTALKIVPIINATDIIEAKKDEEVNVIEIVNGWACVESGTVKGWIRKEKLQTLEETQAIKQQEAQAEAQAQAVAQAQAEAQAQAAAQAEAQAQVQNVNKTLYVKEESINLRQEANTTSGIIANLVVNTEVRVTQEANGWSKVQVNGKEGYILSSLLSEQKQATSRSQDTARQPAQTQPAPADQNQTPAPAAAPATQSSAPKTTTSNAATQPSGRGSTVVETAKKYLGCKYVYGGTTPSGFDCSGFTQYVYKQHGVSLNRTAASQTSNGTAVSKANLQPGDLVFFGKGSISHVGIYIGGGSFIHAANSRTGVITSTLNSGYYCNNYSCARRIM